MHHIRYRSQGGSDIRENLIRLCMYCHRSIHDARYDRTELIAIVAKREGKTAEEVAQAIGVVL
jgi:5-methylcytosine-specific restriction endonuclease McrA